MGIKCRRVADYTRRLDSLFDRARELDDVELLGHWGRYLCVLVSGLLEVAVCEIFTEYAEGRADATILQFVRRSLEDVKNPRAGRIREVARWFNDNWAKQLELDIEDRHIAAINGIMDNRHRIAHGRTSDISYRRLQDWYEDVLDVIERIEAVAGI